MSEYLCLRLAGQVFPNLVIRLYGLVPCCALWPTILDRLSFQSARWSTPICAVLPISGPMDALLLRLLVRTAIENQVFVVPKPTMEVLMRGEFISRLGVFLLGLAGLVVLARAENTPRDWLSLQGMLRSPSGLAYADGDYPMCFTLYTAKSGGSPLWQECDTVHVEDGLYSTVLADNSPIQPGIKAQWLEISLEGATLEGRIPLTGVPRAFSASIALDSVAEGAHLGKDIAVRSLNGLRNDITLKAGVNVALETREDTMEISVPVMIDDSAHKTLAELNAWKATTDFKFLNVSGDRKFRMFPAHHANYGNWEPPRCSGTTEGTIYYEKNPDNDFGSLRFCTEGPAGAFSWKKILVQ